MHGISSPVPLNVLIVGVLFYLFHDSKELPFLKEICLLLCRAEHLSSRCCSAPWGVGLSGLDVDRGSMRGGHVSSQQESVLLTEDTEALAWEEQKGSWGVCGEAYLGPVNS